MKYMKKVQNEKTRQTEYSLSPSKRALISSIVLGFVVGVVSHLNIGCATDRIITLRPPPCPIWTEDAVLELELLFELQAAGEIDIADLEYTLGEQQRHCEALDVYINWEFVIE
jgi:hypothetical protein